MTTIKPRNIIFMAKYNLQYEVRKRLWSISCCLYCGATGKLTIDHIIPRSKGGRSSLDNVTKACERCNQIKSAHDIPQFLSKVSDYRFNAYYMLRQTVRACRKEDDEETLGYFYEGIRRYRQDHSYYTRIINSIQNNNFIIHPYTSHMLTAKEVADKMNGRIYGDEDVYANDHLKSSNLLVVYGASDDLLEFRGVIDDEFGVYEGGDVYLFMSPKGWKLISDSQVDEFNEAVEDTALADLFSVDLLTQYRISAQWEPKSSGGEVIASWGITAHLPAGMGYYSFTILNSEDRSTYCLGLVIDMNIQVTD